MGRWVLLVHELSDGSWHYDWMIQPEGPPDTPLTSFRTMVRPDEPGASSFQAERIGDHRAEYLRFEGALSDGRGSVRRLASGAAAIGRDDDQFIVTIDDGKTWIGSRRDLQSPRYQFRLSDGPLLGHTGQRVTPFGETRGSGG